MIALPPGAAQGGSFVIYLDYSANAPVDERVLAAFCDAERGCIGNANSAHAAGQQARSEMERAVASIAAAQRALSARGVCVSVKSACSVENTPSRAVYAVSRDRKNALASWRISLSHRTTAAELDAFLSIFDECYREGFACPGN